MIDRLTEPRKGRKTISPAVVFVVSVDLRELLPNGTGNMAGWLLSIGHKA